VNHYEVLGVAATASTEELRYAYRALARELHPDAAGAPVDAQEKMSRCNAAWSVLSDPTRRARYDAALAHQRVSVVGGASALRSGSSSSTYTSEDRDGWVPPPGVDESAPQPASMVQVFGPVLVLMGILMLAGGFVSLAPAMLLFGVVFVAGGVYLMAATAVISMRSGRRRRAKARP
jgi:hypothetical protein